MTLGVVVALYLSMGCFACAFHTRFTSTDPGEILDDVIGNMTLWPWFMWRALADLHLKQYWLVASFLTALGFVYVSVHEWIWLSQLLLGLGAIKFLICFLLEDSK